MLGSPFIVTQQASTKVWRCRAATIAEKFATVDLDDPRGEAKRHEIGNMHTDKLRARKGTRCYKLREWENERVTRTKGRDERRPAIRDRGNSGGEGVDCCVQRLSERERDAITGSCRTG